MNRTIAIDFGTTNTVISYWSEEEYAPTVIRLTKLSRHFDSSSSIDNSHSIPTALHILMSKKKFFWQPAYEVKAGQKALALKNSFYQKSLIKNFKPLLMINPYTPALNLEGKSFSARKIAEIFFQEIFRELKKELGLKIKEIIFTLPVDSYEPYRAQIKDLAKKLGVRKVKMLDEPVGAAIGYGLEMDRPQNVLVVDFGGGTLDLALVHMSEKLSGTGRCQILTKAGVPLGGNNIDRWLVDYFLEKMAYNIEENDPQTQWWYYELLEEACRIKESLYFKEVEYFDVLPPAQFQNFQSRINASDDSLSRSLEITKEEFQQLLKDKGLYSTLFNTVKKVLEQAKALGISHDEIHEVLLTGGSSLLPLVFNLFVKFFGRTKVHSWQPFNSVSYGACAYGSGRITRSDHIVHDYAVMTYEPKTNTPQYNVVIPAHTSYPTVEDFWKRRLIPTCARGVPEKIFKLVICEIGKKHSIGQEFIWDNQGKVHILDEDGPSIIVPLNQEDPVLGYLDPPHSPKEKLPRLEISFMVNEDRWLCTTILDLKTEKFLTEKKPIMKLR